MSTPFSKSRPTLFIIFGATGDLHQRKIAPAIYNLFLENWMPDNYAILGTSIEKLTEDDFRTKTQNSISQFSRKGKVEKSKWEEYAQNISY